MIPVLKRLRQEDHVKVEVRQGNREKEKLRSLVVHACLSSLQKMEAGSSEVQGHPSLQRKLDASLGYERPCIIKERVDTEWWQLQWHFILALRRQGQVDLSGSGALGSILGAAQTRSAAAHLRSQYLVAGG